MKDYEYSAAGPDTKRYPVNTVRGKISASYEQGLFWFHPCLPRWSSYVASAKLRWTTHRHLVFYIRNTTEHEQEQVVTVRILRDSPFT